jgi:hypothetical protein
MRNNELMFATKKARSEMSELLQNWINDPQDIKSAFIKLKGNLSEKQNVSLDFMSRPGVSHSLRATINNQRETHRPLFVMIDIIDDDSENRWLSVCFYDDMVQDPDEKRDFVPGGLLGEDGLCFDLYEHDEAMISYVGQRIDEAHANMFTLNMK